MIEIIVNEEQGLFHLRNTKISYVIKVEQYDLVSQQYFGARIESYEGGRTYPRVDRSFSPNFYAAEDRLFSKDTLLQEYSSYGAGDFRTSSIKLRQPNGSSVVDFRYSSYEVLEGKRTLQGLPHFYADSAKTLVIVMKDPAIANVELHLYYSIFEHGAIVRSAEIFNHAKEKYVIEKMDSLQLDIPESDFELISLPGAWANERQMQCEPLAVGTKLLTSNRGASSHQMNPFAALVRKETTEFQGEVYGFSFVYSGSFQFSFEKEQYHQLRINIGLNPQQFEWELNHQESFQTPEAILVYSEQGLNGMSNEFHQMVKQHLLRGQYKDTERPILVNNWEATYFDFNEQTIKQLIDEAADLGIELFVLDDGWYGKRNNDKTSLGDWDINYEKLPNGLTEMIRHGAQKNVAFGIWLEPEMISEESELFKAHPEWTLQVPSREKSRSRDQFVLDFSRRDVRAYIYEKMRVILGQNNIRYVKWDMNRHLSEVFSAQLVSHKQKETHHRYMLGLYEFLEQLTEEFPHVLFESCSGGGGRFDLGMLYYMPQTWASDNTDAIARLKIQYATSFIFPIVTMGSHVSDVPNHQTHRMTSLQMRGDVAMSGTFGYELNLITLPEEHKEQLKAQVAFYKTHRQLIQYGDFYRLLSPYDGNDCAWMFVNKQKTECLVFYYKVLEQAASPFRLLKLAALDHEKIYHNEKLGSFTGSELMRAGFYTSVAEFGDFRSEVYYFKVSEEAQ